jgi:cell division protein FtsB
MDAKMRTIGLFLILILLGLQYKLWFGEGSVFHWTQLDKKLARQEEINRKLAARNRAVEADIAELKSGDQALEEQARYDLGMVKQGEVYYQFVD